MARAVRARPRGASSSSSVKPSASTAPSSSRCSEPVRALAVAAGHGFMAPRNAAIDVFLPFPDNLDLIGQTDRGSRAVLTNCGDCWDGSASFVSHTSPAGPLRLPIRPETIGLADTVIGVGVDGRAGEVVHDGVVLGVAATERRQGAKHDLQERIPGVSFVVHDCLLLACWWSFSILIIVRFECAGAHVRRKEMRCDHRLQQHEPVNGCNLVIHAVTSWMECGLATRYPLDPC